MKKKILLSLLTSLLLCFCCGFWVNAEETSTASFFLHKFNYAREEDGSTIAYPLDDYLPNLSQHQLIREQIISIATGETTKAINEKLQAGEKMTEDEVAQLKDSFRAVAASLGESYPTPQNNPLLAELILGNYEVTLEEISSGSVQVLWYVVKTDDAIGNDGCGYHVDGVVYNVDSNSFVIPITTYKYIVQYNFYLKENDNSILEGSLEEEYGTDTSTAVIINTEREKTYQENLYKMLDEDSSSMEIIPTEDGVIIAFNFYREEQEEKSSTEEDKDEEELDNSQTPQEEHEENEEQNSSLIAINAPQTGDISSAYWFAIFLVALIFFILAAFTF